MIEAATGLHGHGSLPLQVTLVHLTGTGKTKVRLSRLNINWEGAEVNGKAIPSTHLQEGWITKVASCNFFKPSLRVALQQL